MYRIEVSGTPVAKPRPRGFKTKTGNIRFYTPTKGKRFENLIRERAEIVFKNPLDYPIKINVTFYMPRPKRLIWKTKPMPDVPCPHRPDCSNLLKAIEDGLNGVAYLDDAQITDVKVQKRYHAGGKGPKTIIQIEQDIS